MARDLMTVDVVTVPPETPVLAIARLLSERRISAVPVLDRAGTVRGIVTEADLIRRLAGTEERPRGWLAGLFTTPGTQAERYARIHGVNADEVMTKAVVTVAEDTSIAHIAQLMEARNIRRVLVVQDGQLRGLVSRADLLRALVAPPVADGDLSDERIRAAVLAAMRQEAWVDSAYTLVEVSDGVVEFYGFMRAEGVKRGLRVLAENVPGVRGVVDRTVMMPSYLYAA